MTIDKPEKIWGNGINLSGLWSDCPVTFTYDDELGGWWHEDGNIDIKELGLHKSDNWITFSSIRFIEVAAWTEGVTSVFAMLRKWAQ